MEITAFTQVIFFKQLEIGFLVLLFFFSASTQSREWQLLNTLMK